MCRFSLVFSIYRNDTINNLLIKINNLEKLDSQVIYSWDITTVSNTFLHKTIPFNTQKTVYPCCSGKYESLLDFYIITNRQTISNFHSYAQQFFSNGTVKDFWREYYRLYTKVKKFNYHETCSISIVSEN